MMKVYAFDVDETLESSGGPISTSELKRLRDAGHIVGIIGNTFGYINKVIDWHKTITFFNITYTFKHVQLIYIKQKIKAQEYIFIGNTTPSNSPYSDRTEAEQAQWTFIDANDYNPDDHI